MPLDPEYMNFLSDNALVIITLTLITLAFVTSVVNAVNASKDSIFAVAVTVFLFISFLLFAGANFAMYAIIYLPDEIISMISREIAIRILQTYITTGLAFYIFSLFFLFTCIKNHSGRKYYGAVIALYSFVFPYVIGKFWFLLIQITDTTIELIQKIQI